MAKFNLTRFLHCAFTALGFLAIAEMACATEVPKTMPDVCDREWDRIKSVGPIERSEYERILDGPEKARYIRFYTGEVVSFDEVKPVEAMADLYYLLARVPFVIGAEQFPTTLQRDAWLDKAAGLGHKAARAALMRRRYLNAEIPEEKRVSREAYLRAALESAETGDPEFATVLMDTALDRNRAYHCRNEDRDKSPTRNGCNIQNVVKPVEARRWAEVAARGGNPHAKNFLCTAFYFATSPHLGFEKNDDLAFQWCFATHQTACSTNWNIGILAEMYEIGRGTGVDKRKAAELRKLDPVPRYLRKRIQFPQLTQ